MPEEAQGGEADLSEEVTAETEDATTAAPPLNREQRRAQAKGKKGTPGAINPAMPHAQNLRGQGSSHAAGGETRFQRKSGGK
ncbi:MAG: hypothetical protein M3Y28_00135 [Armatimonadota bacterium]|nr:hypothetical protein [Armatimonadota bacterium]